MNQEQTNITTGKQIRHLRTQLGMTQEELAGELNVTRQALSNWERDVNEPDLNMLKKICFLFGVNMDDFAKEVITKMETYEKKEKRQFNKYDMAIGLFYGVGIFLGIGIFFVGGFMTMSGAGWGASLFGGGCFSLVFGLISLNVKLVVSDFLYFFVLGFSPFPGSGKRYPAESSLAWGARSNVLDALPWHSRRLHAA